MLKKIMKQYFLFCIILLTADAACAQLPESYIISGKDTSTNFMTEYKKGLLLHNLRNYKINYATRTSIELLHIAFPPASGDRVPEVGTYSILQGDKKKIKKGSFTVRMLGNLTEESVEGAGQVTVSYANELYTIEVKDAKMKNSKTGEEKTLNAKFVLFIGN